MWTEMYSRFTLSHPLNLGGDGLRVAIKECLAIKGLPTPCGSAVFEGAKPADTNSAVVDKLISAGCAIIGTTNMHELAFGIAGINPYLGTPLNPYWPERIPGGSSSGCASLVASGECDFSVSTDTGGSIRMPACSCGIFGMKPSFGRISRAGAIPVESSLDCIGPIARSAAMLTKAMAVMDPHFISERIDAAPRLSRVAVEADTAIEKAFDNKLGDLLSSGAILPHFFDANEAALDVISAEAATAFGDFAHGTEHAARARILSPVITAPETDVRANKIRTTFRAEVDAALETADALVLPTMPSVPPTLDEAEYMVTLLPLTAFVRPFNLSGHPAITIPIQTADGLPAGIQLVGHMNDDARLCAIAEWLAIQLALQSPSPASQRKCTTFSRWCNDEEIQPVGEVLLNQFERRP